MPPTRAYCDCHVNIWTDEQVLPLWGQLQGRVRHGELAPKADADTLHAEMAHVEKAIVFALRYGDSIGIEGNDETTAAAVAKYPDKFVGFAYVDPRRADCMEMLRHGIEDLGLKGAKFGPIYNGVALADPRMAPVLDYLQRNNLPLTMHMGTTFARNAPIELGRAIHPARRDHDHPLRGRRQRPESLAGAAAEEHLGGQLDLGDAHLILRTTWGSQLPCLPPQSGEADTLIDTPS